MNRSLCRTTFFEGDEPMKLLEAIEPTQLDDLVNHLWSISADLTNFLSPNNGKRPDDKIAQAIRDAGHEIAQAHRDGCNVIAQALHAMKGT
jgi:hypothetical protein